MKSKAGLIVLAALLALPAWATDKDPPKADPSQRQEQEQEQAQQQSQSQQASANNEGVSQAVNFRDRLQAPASFSPSIAPTAPCYYSASGGLSIPGGSIGGGRAFKDDACENRENIRLAYSIGLVAEGDYLFCSTIGRDIPNCGARPPSPPAPEAKPLVVVLQGDGCGRRYDEKLKRVLEGCVGK